MTHSRFPIFLKNPARLFCVFVAFVVFLLNFFKNMLPMFHAFSSQTGASQRARSAGAVTQEP